MTAKAYIGMGMEGSIARWYEKNTAKDMEEFRRLAGRISGFLPAGSAILEVAPGPGLTLVVGRNGSGKSSFAEGLEVLLTGDSLRWKERAAVWRDGWRNTG